MIHYEEHFVTPKQILCCEFFPDKSSAIRRQERLQSVIKREIMLHEKKNLKTAEGVYKSCYMVSYLCGKG